MRFLYGCVTSYAVDIEKNDRRSAVRSDGLHCADLFQLEQQGP